MRSRPHRHSGRPAAARALRQAIFFAWAAAALFAAALGPAHANFIEQMAVDARAIALANAVTADPPGIAAVHYNPAGLSLLPEGKYFSSGLTVPFIKITSRFDTDPAFEGFLGGYNNDPLNHTVGKNTSGRMYVPLVDQEIDFLAAPILGMSYRPADSRWSLAIGNYVPFGVGFAHDDDNDPVRFGARHAYMQHLVYMAPSVSYQLTDTLAAGLTVGVGQTAVGVGLDMRSPNDLVTLTRVLGDATGDLEIPILSELTLPPPWFGGGIGPYDPVASLQLAVRDDFSPNYNLGLLWEPWQWVSLGAVYQSPIKVQLTGAYRFDYTETFQQAINWLGSSPTLLMVSGMLNLPFNAVPYQSGKVSAEMEFPQRVQMGIKLKPFKRISLLADLAWSDWSSIKEDRFVFDQDIQLLKLVKVLGYTGGNRELVLQRDFKDTWSYSLGLEIHLTDWLSLLLGYENRPSSVSDQHFDCIYSLPDLESYGAGFSIKLKSGTQIDLGFAYLINEEYKVRNNGSDLLNSTDPFNPVYNPYAGLNYRQKTETYLASFKVSMPLHVMSEMIDDIFGLLNPFDGGKRHARPGSSKVPQDDWTPPAGSAAGLAPALPAGESTPLVPMQTGPYTLELARLASAQRAQMALDFYQGERIIPELRTVREADGATRYRIQVGRFEAMEAAERYKADFQLTEAVIQPLNETAPLPVRFTLRLAVDANEARARMTADFYGREGLAVRVAPYKEGYAVVTGDFDSEAAARRFGRDHHLPEAEPVPLERSAVP